MKNRKLAVGTVGLCLALGASGVAVAANTAAVPKKTTITAITSIKMVPNRYIQDGLRWNKDDYVIKSGGTLTILNNAADEGPHTFTVVKEKDLPRTAKAVENCRICNTLAKAHGADPNSDAPPKFQYLENGVGTHTAPQVNQPGDSGVTGKGTKGESINLTVTAPAGTKLYFMCLIHPWMQAVVNVT